MDKLINEIEKRIYRWEHTFGSSETRKRAKYRSEECKQILRIVRKYQMIDKNEYIEVSESECTESSNCFGVKEEDGKKYCRGCGSHQPNKIISK